MDRQGTRGLTLTEIMIASAVFVIMGLMFSPMFSISQKTFTALEASSTLKDSGQKALNRISYDLNHCRRLFQEPPLGDVTSDNYLYAQNVAAHLDGMPQPLAGSRLPLINSYTALSPTDINFQKDKVGNSLFMASQDPPQNLTAKEFSADYLNVRCDTYHFSLYYLAASPGNIGGKALPNLWEWHSVSFADFRQLTLIMDNIVTTATIHSALAQGVQYAWDPSANYDSAFHKLSYVNYPPCVTATEPLGCGGIYSTMTVLPDPPPAIAKRSGGPAVKILVGSGGGSYVYGVSPNTGADFTIKHTVPSYAAPEGQFPSGFEVVMAGPPGGRVVLVRLVLVAGGAGSLVYSREQTLLESIPDIN